MFLTSFDNFKYMMTDGIHKTSKMLPFFCNEDEVMIDLGSNFRNNEIMIDLGSNFRNPVVVNNYIPPDPAVVAQVAHAYLAMNPRPLP